MALPTMTDLRYKFGPVEQQGAPNSCVAHAVTSAIEAILGLRDQSRLFVYYNARRFANQTTYDAGCQPRNAVKGIATYGVCDETYWPYDLAKLTTSPSAASYSAALPVKSRIKAYQSVTTLAAMKTALSQGLPVVFCFMVPDTFVSVTRYSGFLPLPTSSTTYLGGHSVVAVGYNDATGNIICRNSFGSTWGNQGYFEMPYGWFSSMTSKDAWTFIPI